MLFLREQGAEQRVFVVAVDVVGVVFLALFSSENPALANKMEWFKSIDFQK